MINNDCNIRDKVMIQSKSRNETNDCSVIAMSIVLRKPYDEVHEMFARCGRKYREGVWQTIVLGVLYEFDVDFRRYNRFDVEDIGERHLGQKIMTFKQILPVLDPCGRYYASSRKHAAAIVGGKVLDWAKDTEKTVISLIEIYEK